MPIRLAPTSFGAKSATVTVTSDDPAGPKTVTMRGEAPSGTLVITGSTCIGGVKECCLGERTIALCNVGECDLHVKSVAFRRKSPHWRLINSPFPTTLRPGSCLSVLIRYKATEKCPRACELVIVSDDPANPVRTLDVMAYTIPGGCDCCDAKGRENCCGGCGGKCNGPCNTQAIDSCCGDEGDDMQDDEKS
jgi:hypothetical protein